jgi:hypothetical protein
MFFSLLYRVVRRAFELVRLRVGDSFAKEAEIFVLRHQLAVLRREVKARASPGPTARSSCFFLSSYPVIDGDRFSSRRRRSSTGIGVSSNDDGLTRTDE